ncbi:C-Maf-inducing protein [Daphnia magna]|uniref:C-Maf-inducing protein n=1 Tax=Daphnia magna TaxID=35525 RepID=A0A162NYB9_9CRUS|nr:C-Maf-inducing protein [Daphnia magna]
MKCCDLLMSATRLLLTPASTSDSTSNIMSSPASAAKECILNQQSIWLNQPTSTMKRRSQTLPDLYSPSACASAASALERRLSSHGERGGHGDSSSSTANRSGRRRRKDLLSSGGAGKEQVTMAKDEPQPRIINDVHSGQAFISDRTALAAVKQQIPAVHDAFIRRDRALTAASSSLNSLHSSARRSSSTTSSLFNHRYSRSALVLTRPFNHRRYPETVSSSSTGHDATCATSVDVATVMMDDETTDESSARLAVYQQPPTSVGDGRRLDVCRSAPATPHLPRSQRAVGRQQETRRNNPLRNSKSSCGFNDPIVASMAVQDEDPTATRSTCSDAAMAKRDPDSEASSDGEVLVNASSCLSPPPPVIQRRFLKLLSEGDIQLCRVTHSGTVIGKILSSKFLRRWETHHLYLNDAQISSKTPSGFMEESTPYSSMKDISLVVSSSSSSSLTSSAYLWDRSYSDPGSMEVMGAAAVGSSFATPPSHYWPQHCLIRIVLPEGCLLLQANNAYVRDQWYHSIIWKKNLFRYHQITRRTTRQEVLLKEVKSMVELATSTPLQDHCIAQAPFQVISSLLSTVSEEKSQHHQQNRISIGMPGGCYYSQTVLEDLLLTLSPLLERQPPSREMCTAFSRHCRLHPRSSLVRGLFTSVVHRILKHNVDFGKNPFMRRFVHDYIRVLYAHNDGPQAVRDFVQSAHGEGSACPHPRVLPNLVAVCLAAVFSIYEYRRRRQRHPSDWVNIQANHPVDHNEDKLTTAPIVEPMAVEDRPVSQDETQRPHKSNNNCHSNNNNNNNNNSNNNIWDMQCYLTIIKTACEFEDWRPGLAQLLQPVPFPDEALVDDVFIKGMGVVVGAIGNDPRCAVHQCVLGIREGKEGWFHVICPSSAACCDDGSLWASILKTLLDCCCRRKAFLASMTKLVGACQLLALRDHSSAQETLCLMLEWNLLEVNAGQENSQCGTNTSAEERDSLPLQIATTLQSTESGRRLYFELCDRQLHLKELQQKGGPKKLTLPNRSTDDDLSKLLLNCGSLGNLECLSLAFTQVTSACAQHLIKLPSLRYLNLWSTQFGDPGLQLISEHLHKLQVLNLCETPVTDKGLACLASMKSLRKLNLNSTTLSVSTFEKLKQKLPSLQECDVRYTDAW